MGVAKQIRKHRAWLLHQKVEKDPMEYFKRSSRIVEEKKNFIKTLMSPSTSLASNASYTEEQADALFYKRYLDIETVEKILFTPDSKNRIYDNQDGVQELKGKPQGSSFPIKLYIAMIPAENAAIIENSALLGMAVKNKLAGEFGLTHVAFQISNI